jgi:uncharacterized protein YgbK (DUF1537 family)
MSGLRLLADDLTGALDAAAPFASATTPVTVHWLPEDEAGAAARSGDWPEGDVAISSTSRHLPAVAAVARVDRLARGLAGGTPAFKKIDSLLRGNTAAEIIAAHRGGGFAATLVAPAFPAQGRLVREGRLRVRDGAGAEQDGPDLAALLGAAGGDQTIRVCDAESEADLQHLVLSHRRQARILWAGSAGLARALAGSDARCAVPQASTVLVVTGSRHHSTRAQIAAAVALLPDAAIRDDGADQPERITGAVVDRLRTRWTTVLDASPPPMGKAEAASRMRAAFAGLAAGQPPDLLVVSGGDTLIRLLAALGCDRLLVHGEVAAGMPLSRIEGGPWRGTRLISKSGAFDDGGLIRSLIAPAARSTARSACP